MSTNVFANGLEVAAKKSDNQSIAAMPDVCLSPPSPPAGPIPIPYPNFSAASDMADGTKTVKIAGDEAGMKDQSNYKTSKGDEAATRSFGMGVVSHSIQGKTYFSAWSSDVMFEGANAVRFMDMTTHNHGSPSNPPSVTASTGIPGVDVTKIDCEELEKRNEADKKELPSEYAGKGNTNTNYKLDSNTPGVASETAKAHSKVAVQQMFDDDRYVVGKPASDRLKDTTTGSRVNESCTESQFKYSAEFFKGGHTEARIVEHLFAKSPGAPLSGTLTMKINWQATDPAKCPSECAPCEHCHAILCAAHQCGLNIVLCSEKNKEVPLQEDDCQKDLDMTKEDVRKSMKEKNRGLVARLKSAEF